MGGGGGWEKVGGWDGSGSWDKVAGGRVWDKVGAGRRLTPPPSVRRGRIEEGTFDLIFSSDEH